LCGLAISGMATPKADHGEGRSELLIHSREAVKVNSVYGVPPGESWNWSILPNRSN
jgi:hypothetical protein